MPGVEGPIRKVKSSDCQNHAQDQNIFFPGCWTATLVAPGGRPGHAVGLPFLGRTNGVALWPNEPDSTEATVPQKRRRGPPWAVCGPTGW
jgi:hypothetical protein